jgi:hypothetical protein
MVFQLDNETLAAPKLYIVTVNQLLCPNDGVAVIAANEGSKTLEVPVIADDISPVICHRIISTAAVRRQAALRFSVIAADRHWRNRDIGISVRPFSRAQIAWICDTSDRWEAKNFSA